MEYDLVDLLIEESLKKAVARYGIEGAEQKINELYVHMPVAKDRILEVYKKIYKGTK